MKIAPPSISPARTPPRPQQRSTSSRGAFPLPNPDESDPSMPFVRQLFRSLDNSADNHGPQQSEQQKTEGHPPMVLLPLPIRSAPKAVLTPPPSPFGYSKTPPKTKSFATAAVVPKTPSSIKTAETESIASFSTYGAITPISSTATTPRSSPNSIRPRVSSIGSFTSGNSSRPSSPSAFSAHRSSVFPTPPKPFPTKPKKKARTLPPTESKNNASRASPSPTKSNKSRMHKTELCTYFVSGEPCPFGDNCHYAHGEHELQTKRLLTLQRLGQIENAYTYRIKPCFSHVAMGSCPFGKRCACIHDPRVTGTVQSWLPVTETQGNNIMTDINVEGLHQKRRFDILHGDPFVRESNSPSLVENLHKDYHNETYHWYEWKDLYNVITNCNTHSKNATRVRRKRANNSSKRQMLEIHKASIAVQMHGGTHRWMYKYRPSHTIFNEMCMVLDKRAFHLDAPSGKAIPIALSKYQSKNPSHCIVREIAFGPDGDPSVRPVSLWFNIPGDKVSECTLSKSKLFRWHKQKSSQPMTTSKNSDGFKVVATSPFESYDSLIMIRPIDQEAFLLVKDILEHRYASLKAEAIPSIRERSRALQEVEKEHILLGERFSNLKHHWATWAFPSAAGRRTIDDDTPVPPADENYDPGESSPTKFCFRESRKVWTSFLSTLQDLKTDDEMQDGTTKSSSTGASYLMGDFNPNAQTKTKKPRYNDNKKNNKRLSVFVELSQGQAVNQNNRSLPHIKNKPTSSGETPRITKPKASYIRQSERCWKSLLLEGDGIHETEWDAVVNHFTNSSRSQKVLNIVQQ